MQKKADLVVRHARIIGLDSSRGSITDGAVAVAGGVIVAAGPDSDVAGGYLAEKTIDATGKLLVPGFISTHTHLFQGLLKGLGRDKPLFAWLDSSVLRVLHLYDYELLHLAALAGLIEAVRTGTTTVLDFQYCHSAPDLDMAVVAAFERIGVRGVLGKSHVPDSTYPADLLCPPRWHETEEDYFESAGSLCRQLADHPLVSAALAPTIIWSHDRDGFIRLRELADSWKVPITMHVAETRDDDCYSLETWGQRTVPFLDSCGLLGPDFLAVHCVQVEESDIDLFRERKVAVAHCPVANMVLGSGAAPVPRFLDEGITVSLGVDGAASNDTQDMLETMKMAALKHKLVARDASLVPASEVLKMATLGGARALGAEERLGSLDAGKRADFFIYDPLHSRSIPVHNPVATLVYSSAQPNVETVVIDGRVILENGRFAGIDERGILKECQRAADLLARRAGLV